MLIIEPSVTTQSLIARGVPKKTLGLFKPLEERGGLSQFLMTKLDDSGMEIKAPVKPVNQQKWLDRMLDDPYHGPYVAYLSDYRTGDIARSLAAVLFSRACAQYSAGTTRDRPLWVRLHQGFDNQVPLKGNDRPSMLVLDNVFVDSTPVKVEKLRDLLAYYDDTPVLVIVSTPGSPLSVAEAFSLPVDYALLVQDTRMKTKEESI